MKGKQQWPDPWVRQACYNLQGECGASHPCPLAVESITRAGWAATRRQASRGGSRWYLVHVTCFLALVPRLFSKKAPTDRPRAALRSPTEQPRRSEAESVSWSMAATAAHGAPGSSLSTTARADTCSAQHARRRP